MTINSTIRKAGPFIGNGTASSFPFTYKVFQASDLDVVRLDQSTNVETTLALTTDYTVTLNQDQDSNPGGTVTLVSGPLATGYTLTMTSDVPNLQPTDLTNQGGFYPEVINDALDRATIQIQQLQEQTDRSLKVSVSSTVDATLPPPNPNDLIGWDANAAALINVDPTTIGTVVAYATAYADVFIGNGVTTSWTLTRPAAVLYNLDVSINGATQEPTRDYTLAGTTFTMTTPPPIGARVLVKYKEGLPSYSGDAQDIRFLRVGTSTVARSVQAKLQESMVHVRDFGADPSYDAATNTAAIQAAFNYLEANGGTLEFAQGTYNVTAVEMSQAGGNARRNFFINGNGALLQGTTSSTPFRVYRCQGLAIDGLRVAKHASATYASNLDSFWFADFRNCSFGETRLHADVNWGVYWNAFTNCSFGSLHFDLTNYTINQNTWYTCQVGPITKTDALHGTFKEAYNNVFVACDMLGAIDWRDSSTAFHDPIVLRDCNMEYTGVNYGYIISEGGRSNPVDAVTTKLFPWSDLRSEYNMQYSGSSWSTGWKPWSDVNLFRGGAAQSYSPDIASVGVSNAPVITADATSPSGNGYCYRMTYSGGSANPRIRIRMPQEYLAQAKQVGYVSFCVDVKSPTSSGPIICNTSGTLPSGDAYPSGYPAINTSWQKIFVTVPVSSSATEVVMYIGGSTTTNFDVSVTNIGVYLGKIARPYTPGPNEVHPSRGVVVSKALTANGSAQNTFSLTIPASNISGRVLIKASYNAADGASIYEGELFYARHSTGSQITANIVERGKAQVTYGGGVEGTISAMAASASGSTVTVTTTVANYSGTPSRTITYQLEFLDWNETVTVL